MFDGSANSFISITEVEVFDPDLILRAECIEIPGKKDHFFVDLVFHLNRVIRRRLSLTRCKKDEKTRVFRTPQGILSVLKQGEVGEIVFYLGDKAISRIEEVRNSER
jgi:hypothetical protein